MDFMKFQHMHVLQIHCIYINKYIRNEISEYIVSKFFLWWKKCIDNIFSNIFLKNMYLIYFFDVFVIYKYIFVSYEGNIFSKLVNLKIYLYVFV